MQIRKMQTCDINNVVELWYQISVDAHDFISPDYWKKNKERMAAEYLPASETYLAIEENQIVGFIAMVDNYLAAIFVKTEMQGKGIGRQLLDYIKNQRETIQLKVYKKNSKSVRFYENQGFKPLSENKEGQTGEIEYLMQWNK